MILFPELIKLRDKLGLDRSIRNLINDYLVLRMVNVRLAMNEEGGCAGLVKLVQLFRLIDDAPGREIRTEHELS